MKSSENSPNHFVVSIQNSSKDNKHSQSIDKKFKKIEQLKKQIQKIENTIHIAKRLYNEHCKEEKEKLFKVREQFFIKLYKRYQQKGFTLWQKEMISSKLMNGIDELISSGYQSEVLVSIYEEVSAFELEKMDDSEKEFMNDVAKEFFRDIGIDVDEEDFDFEDFSEQFQEKYSKEHQRFFEENEAKRHDAKEEKVKKTNTDFQKLYKSLVKKAHPD